MGLEEMSTHNPLFRVLVQNLPDTSANMKLRKRLLDSMRSFDYSMLLDTYKHFSEGSSLSLTVKVVVSKIYIFCSCRSSDIVLYLT